MRARSQLRSLTHPARRGFTLVELLVAVGIILVLAGLTLLVANSGIVGNARTSSGSDRIGGWLMQAREKAKRDNAPRGIRFIVGADGFVREAQLVEVPEPYVMPVGYVLMIENSPAGRRIYLVPDMTKLPPASNAVTELNNNLAVGDTLSIRSTDTIHRVTGWVAAGVAPGAAEIQVADPTKIPALGAATATVAGTPTYSTTTFGFLRQPRPTFGEPPLLLPDTVAIDGANTQPAVAANSSLDVIFSPNGEVYNPSGLGKVVLWTRNPEAFAGNPVTANGGGDRPSYEQAGEMRLIVVYTKTGAVAVQPVALPPGPGPAAHDPYTTTRDGIASGL